MGIISSTPSSPPLNAMRVVSSMSKRSHTPIRINAGIVKIIPAAKDSPAEAAVWAWLASKIVSAAQEAAQKKHGQDGGWNRSRYGHSDFEAQIDIRCTHNHRQDESQENSLQGQFALHTDQLLQRRIQKRVV